MNRVHSSEEAPRSFTMAPCVVVERLEALEIILDLSFGIPINNIISLGVKAAVQQNRRKRARRNPSPRMIKVTVHKKRKVNEEQPTPASSPSRNHDSAAPRQNPLICTGAEPIHQVHGPPKPRATESMLRNRIHISAIYLRTSNVTVVLRGLTRFQFT